MSHRFLDCRFSTILVLVLISTGVLFGCSQEPRGEDDVLAISPLLGFPFDGQSSRGDEFFVQGDLFKAVSEYTQLLKESKKDTLQRSCLTARRAWSYSMQDDTKNAISDMDAVFSHVAAYRSSDQLHFKMLLCRILTESKRWAEAFRRLDSEPEGSDFADIRDKAELLYRAGDTEGFKKIVKSIPGYEKSSKDIKKLPKEYALRKKDERTFEYEKLPHKKRTFNSKEWKDGWSANSRTRFDQVYDLIDSKILLGKSRKEVRRLLGVPSFYHVLSIFDDCFSLGALEGHEREGGETLSLVNGRRARRTDYAYCLVVSYDLDDRVLAMSIKNCGQLAF